MATGAWLVWPVSAPVVEKASPPPLVARSGKSTPPDSPEPSLASAVPVVPASPATAARPDPTSIPHPDATPIELETRFRTTRDHAARLELIDEIASHNDAAAVQSLARLFPTLGHPELKEALLGKLADIDHDTAPTERLATLDAALRATQPRPVRSTALDCLAQLDESDPRVAALLARVARDDADHELRKFAKDMLPGAAE